MMLPSRTVPSPQPVPNIYSVWYMIAHGQNWQSAVDPSCLPMRSFNLHSPLILSRAMQAYLTWFGTECTRGRSRSEVWSWKQFSSCWVSESVQGAEVIEDSDLENSFQAALVSESPLFSNLAPCPVARCSYLDRDFSPGVPNQEKLFTGRGALIRKNKVG